MPQAVIVQCVRTPVGRAHYKRGVYRNVRSDELAAGVMRAVAGSERGDGVVALTSSHSPFAQSEIEIAEMHSNLHRHPLAILEVRRILLEHLASIDASAAEGIRRTDFQSPQPVTSR